MKRPGTFLLALFLGVWIFSAQRLSATTYNSDGSSANVQYLHDNFAQNGDTISLPPGTFVWTSGVTITKGITLQGSGSSSSIIVRSGGFTGSLVTINGFSSDMPVRVTGIRFNSPVGQNGDLQSITLTGPYGGTWSMTQVRIDHCDFYGGERTILVRYRINGVADHNTFQDCAYITEFYGDDDYAWARAGTPNFGTSDAFFYEDNTIVV